MMRGGNEVVVVVVVVTTVVCVAGAKERWPSVVYDSTLDGVLEGMVGGWVDASSASCDGFILSLAVLPARTVSGDSSCVLLPRPDCEADFPLTFESMVGGRDSKSRDA